MTNLKHNTHFEQMAQGDTVPPTLVLIDAGADTIEVRSADPTIRDYEVQYAQRRAVHVGAILAGLITVAGPGDTTSQEVSKAMDATVRQQPGSISKTVAHLRKDQTSPAGDLPGVVSKVASAEKDPPRSSFSLRVGNYAVASVVNRPRGATIHCDGGIENVKISRTLAPLPSEGGGVVSVADQFMWGRGGYVPGESSR